MVAGVRKEPNLQPQYRSKKPAKVFNNTNRQRSPSPLFYDDEIRPSTPRSEPESSPTSSLKYDYDSLLNSEDSQQHRDGRVVSGILDGITSLCLGPPSQYRFPKSPQRHAKTKLPKKSLSPQKRKQKVLYPNANYPTRLDSKELVFERLQLFQQKHLFRPVSCDE